MRSGPAARPAAGARSVQTIVTARGGMNVISRPRTSGVSSPVVGSIGSGSSKARARLRPAACRRASMNWSKRSGPCSGMKMQSRRRTPGRALLPRNRRSLGDRGLYARQREDVAGSRVVGWRGRVGNERRYRPPAHHDSAVLHPPDGCGRFGPHPFQLKQSPGRGREFKRMTSQSPTTFTGLPRESPHDV